MKKNKGKTMSVILVIILIAGLCIFLYPTVGNLLNRTLSMLVKYFDGEVKEDFDVDPVSVCFWELPKGISDEKSLPTNCRINAKLKEFATTLKRPYCLSTEGLEISEWFGSNCDENSIKSQAIMAIKNGDEVFGILALGSNNQNRFFPQMGTIYFFHIRKHSFYCISAHLSCSCIISVNFHDYPSLNILFTHPLDRLYLYYKTYFLLWQ